VPAAGTVEKSLWRSGRPFASAPATELFASAPPEVVGDFSPVDPPEATFSEPRGLAVDIDDPLFVAEAGRGRLLVSDLWSRRLLRTFPTPPGTRPLDLAVAGRTVYATLGGDGGVLRLTARDDPERFELPPEALVPTRIAASPTGY